MRMQVSFSLLVFFVVLLHSVKAVSFRKQYRVDEEEKERIRLLSQAQFGQAAHTIHETGHPSNYVDYGHHKENQELTHQYENQELTHQYENQELTHQYEVQEPTYQHQVQELTYQQQLQEPTYQQQVQELTYQQQLQEPTYQQQVQEPSEVYHYDDPSVAYYNSMKSAQQGHRFRRRRSSKGIVINEPYEEYTPPSSEHSETTESDDEIPISALARIQATGKRHGKGVSHHEIQTSDSDEDHSGLRKFKHLSMIEDGSTPRRKGKQSPKEVAESDEPEGATKEEFQQEWNRLGLRPNLTPIQLADKAALIKMPNLSHRAKSVWSREMMKSYSADTSDHSEFRMRQSRINKHAYSIRKRLAKDSNFAKMDPKDLHYLSLEQSVAHYNDETPTTTKYGHTAIVKRRKQETQDRVDEVGDYVVAYLASKGISLKDLTVDQLDHCVSRNHVYMPGMEHKTFTDHYFRWLQRRMNIPNTTLDILRDDRMKWRTQVRNEKSLKRRQEGKRDMNE